MKVAVIIPALNEAECIGALVAEMLAQPVDKVIVVDNGSTDHTAQKAREAGAEVVSEARRGYGYACAAGAAAADEAEVLIFLDGDYSCLPNEIPALLAPLGEDCPTRRRLSTIAPVHRGPASEPRGAALRPPEPLRRHPWPTAATSTSS